MKPLIIRADASPNIGTGHVMRCLGLAEAWQDRGGDVIFVSACDAPAIHDRVKKEGFPIYRIPHEVGTLTDAEDTIRIAQEQGADWIVVDGYQFGATYQKQIKESGLSLLFIDDYGHADHYYADIILNQNIYADMSFYKNYEPYTRFLLGTRYVLLRREFLKWSGWHRIIPDVARKILVTLGGGDPDNVTLTVVEALKTIDLDGLEVKVVIGGANPHFDLLSETVKDLSNFTLIKSTNSMPELMAWADIAISGGGSTCWELAFMGVPSIVIPIAENQELIAKELRSKNIAEIVEIADLKNQEDFVKLIRNFLKSSDIRSSFSKKMAHSNDGEGTSRIINAMCSNKITLRKAILSDCKKIWLWINDPLVRSVSFHPNLIPLEHHAEWFSSALRDPNLVYFIAEDKNAQQIGQARFQIEAKHAVISVLLDPKYRGLSLGSILIRDATEKVFLETKIEKINAFIKIGNETSRRAFKKAGYRELGLNVNNGENAYHLIKTRGNNEFNDSI
jgi:UDP-2,4-diacetamido-2,4,6-trideoxy-beta-L-altropyranose hydrolase